MEPYYESYTQEYYVVLLFDSEEQYEYLIKELSKYLPKNSKNAIALHNRGLAYLELGDGKGLKDIELSISIDGASKEPYKVLGQFWERNSDLKLALEYFTEAVEADTTDATNFRCRASAYEALGDLDSAIRDLDKAIELEPDFEYTIQHKVKLESRKNS